eukprot:gene46446-62126_t
MGDRGTGKSTTIRALADLLPEIKVVKNDPFNADPSLLQNPDEYEIESIQIPMVELPLGATEDRVCGSINLKEVLAGGTNSFEPDSAASGWNTVEREGISIKHPAKFILVGSGNPEEGELRPQLLDRFGMHAEIRTIREPEIRVRIVEERISFDKNPKAWFQKYSNQQIEIQERLLTAQQLLPNVNIKEDYQFKISRICSELGIEGLRGDLVAIRAAKALAAFEKRTEVELKDIQRTISLCLRHRLRKDPMESL